MEWGLLGMGVLLGVGVLLEVRGLGVAAAPGAETANSRRRAGERPYFRDKVPQKDSYSEAQGKVLRSGHIPDPKVAGMFHAALTFRPGHLPFCPQPHSAD